MQRSNGESPEVIAMPGRREQGAETRCGQGVMSGRDAIGLALLGAARRKPATQDELQEVLLLLAWPSWSPSSALIDEVCYDLVEGGYLKAALPPGLPRFDPSVKGFALFGALMLKRASPYLSPFGQTCIRLKLAFIDMLPEQRRRTLLESIAQASERELILRRRQDRPDVAGWLGQSWMNSEADQIRRQLVGLRSSVYAVNDSEDDALPMAAE